MVELVARPSVKTLTRISLECIVGFGLVSSSSCSVATDSPVSAMIVIIKALLQRTMRVKLIRPPFGGQKMEAF